MIWLTQLKIEVSAFIGFSSDIFPCLFSGITRSTHGYSEMGARRKDSVSFLFSQDSKANGRAISFLSCTESVMFRPIQIVSAQRLEAQAASIADIIGLPLPPVNFYGVTSNYLKRLSNPNDKVLELVCLIQNCSMPLGLCLSKNELRILVSIILVADEIFAGLEEASADDTYRTVDNLWSSYPKDELRDGNNPCVIHSRKSETESMDCDEPSLECVSLPDDHEEKSKESAIKRLITDTGENLFCYIPLRVKVKRLHYLQYVRKKGDGALIYAAHADYYLLLRVCAKVAEIDARNMHRGVLSFERRFAWIEKRIDHVLHLTPPFISTRDTETRLEEPSLERKSFPN
ncbi:unnamed protein product [Arabidopsis arenosa]|uniref:Uncharacterized protein n=1 Tax=Arabidopsis arenosa TaxID=38785 RepID=A0A8S2AVR3_ARAAE|nr:unnamed protein product [Arabidopsis arenosa]